MPLVWKFMQGDFFRKKFFFFGKKMIDLICFRKEDKA